MYILQVVEVHLKNSFCRLNGCLPDSNALGCQDFPACLLSNVGILHFSWSGGAKGFALMKIFLLYHFLLTKLSLLASGALSSL